MGERNWDLLIAGSPRGGLWQIAGESADGESVDIKDDLHVVAIGISKRKAMLLCAEHNAALPRQDAGDEAERLTANELAIMYRLIHQYTEDAYKDLPKDDASHAVRRTLRGKIVHQLIAAREAERALLSAQPGAAGAGGERPIASYPVTLEITEVREGRPLPPDQAQPAPGDAGGE